MKKDSFSGRAVTPLWKEELVDKTSYSTAIVIMLFKAALVKLHTALAVLLWMVQESGWQVYGSWPFESATSSFQDKRLSGSTIKTLFKPFNLCFMECSSHPRCHSINFHFVSSLCELNEATHLSDPDALSHVPRVVYMMYAMRELPYCSQERKFFFSFSNACS